jgi:hypothetical protein
MTDATNRRARGVRCVAVAWSLACATLVPASLARAEEAAAIPQGTDVKIERIRPERPKYETMKFLRENRDFIRARYDALREKPIQRKLEPREIDPRFLAYQQLLAQVRAADDSLARQEEARRRIELLQSITQLGDLESQLDVMDTLLFAQRQRLGVLQADFVGDQRTALMVVASGWPANGAVTETQLTIDDGSKLTIPSPRATRRLRTAGSFSSSTVSSSLVSRWSRWGSRASRGPRTTSVSSRSSRCAIA